ncbi:MAG TPA: HD domain-containing phosphohydrolase [Dermatophilaceae bacterium]|jgi:hypothetical protein|uniref:HD domain-containing protein n=1 Tax=Candidatus Phosphoribacter hodrii TaxID=2953743 RepID=A0A934X4S4_9MICO|nr:HD domain-containing protein [Candidatus Phosphoribacter hodrii]MBP8838044.1 HD domain-containing protein [Dermatophilaceae bacterium]OPZ54917.1 MAG: Cyclic di-GMP phosphodiesterase response regulator RpfG [bacterium ADurb.BinA028]MBL0003262.1 HD domain-containing protein [Candidatus Phosphoribacter hodrii]HNV13061.1 HD domain-containing phosphohydrolase [Dermatophilaceae bacterium]
MSPQAAADPGPRARRVNAVILATLVVAVLITTLAWALDGVPHDYVSLAVLTVLTLGTRVVRVRVVERVAVAASGIVSLASCVLVGPVGSALMMATTILLERGAAGWRARLFNASMGAILGSVGGLTYLLAGGPADLTTISGPGELMVRVGGPFLVASLVFSLVNFASIAMIVRVDSGESFQSMFLAMLTTSGLAQMGYGVIGLLFVILWVPAQVGPFSAVLILLPLFVAQWAFVQYAEEERAHERTLAALVAAGETRDPYAVGHSERVARLSVLLGEGLGLGPAQTEALQYAAILHDIGWLGAQAWAGSDTKAPDKSLSELIARHPAVGVALLSDIAFLQDSLDSIKHHHERWDGRGYPDQLVGTDIPLASRIIAVADSFDSLTRGRPGRQALPSNRALQVVESRAGTHLDPTVVAVLARVLERHTWAVAEPPPEGAGAPLWDHDDPVMSDMLAGIDRPATAGQGS